MTPEQLAARWLADLPRFGTRSIGTRTFVCQHDEGDFVPLADALAAIARHLAPGDDLALDAEQVSRGAKFMAMALWSELHEKAGSGVLPEKLPKDAADVLRSLMQEKLEAAARLSALAPGDDLVAQSGRMLDLAKANSSDDLDECAAYITALLAHIAALTAERSHWMSEARRTLKDGQDALDRAEAAEAEAATLRDRLARMEEALNAIDALDPEGRIGDCSVNAISGLVLRMGGIARAALTDGGSNG